MATREAMVKGVPPGMTREAFVAELRRVGSPAAAAGGRVYDYAAGRGLDCRFLLGVFAEESSMGTNPDAICVGGGGVPEPTYSWGNTTQDATKPSYGHPGTGRVVRGRFSVYPGWYEGGISTVARFFDHPPYVGRGTVEAIIPIWAPPGDNNNTERYIAGVVATMTRLGGEHMAKPKVVLLAGHHNTSGGNAYEYVTTGELVERIGPEMARLGIDVRVITPDGADADTIPGDGDYPGALDAAAAVAVRWAREGWVPDVLLETHTQGVADPAVRGVFGIYPDWAGDEDTDARDRLIPAIVGRVCAAVGFPRFGDGRMSERRTGVGLSGSRLGVFRATEPLKATTTRILIEYGAHTNPVERAAHRTEAFLAGAARATAEAFAEYFGLPLAPVAAQAQPDPTWQPGGVAVTVPGTGREYWIVEPILSHYRLNGALARYGWPLSGLYTETAGEARGLAVQWFERARLEVQPDGTVTEGRLGAELLAARGRAA